MSGEWEMDVGSCAHCLPLPEWVSLGLVINLRNDARGKISVPAGDLSRSQTGAYRSYWRLSPTRHPCLHIPAEMCSGRSVSETEVSRWRAATAGLE